MPALLLSGQFLMQPVVQSLLLRAAALRSLQAGMAGPAALLAALQACAGAGRSGLPPRLTCCTRPAALLAALHAGTGTGRGSLVTHTAPCC